MAFYVTAQDHGRSAFVLGPFRRHGDALARVDAAQRMAAAICRDVSHFDTTFGTARDRRGHGRRGVLNGRAGLILDAVGFVDVN